MLIRSMSTIITSPAGRVTSLNGRPEKGAIVEAVGAGACGLQEEGVTGEIERKII